MCRVYWHIEYESTDQFCEYIQGGSVTDAAALHAYGVMRFCYPARQGYRIEHSSLDAARAYLYDRAYLEMRLAYLEHVALSSLRAQTDQGFSLGILIGDQLPDWALGHLLTLTAQDDNIVLIPTPEGQTMAQAARSAFDRILPQHSGPLLQFRHDDDDAVFCDFIRSIKSMAARHIDMLDLHDTVTFDFTCGHQMMPRPDSVLAKRMCSDGFGVAIAALTRAGHDFRIYDVYHRHLVRDFPTLRDARPRAFIRMQHFANDSYNPKRRPEDEFPVADRPKLNRLCAEMGLDPEQVIALGRFAQGQRPYPSTTR